MSGPQKNSYVYFIRPKGMIGPIKIGCSDVPQKRLENLAAWSPFELEILVTIPGNFSLERKIQGCFLDEHTHREWFRVSPRVLKLIDDLKSGIPIEEALDLSSSKRFGKLNRKPWTEEAKQRASWGCSARKALRVAGEKYPGYSIYASSKVSKILWGSGAITDQDRVVMERFLADPVGNGDVRCRKSPSDFSIFAPSDHEAAQ